MKKKLAIATSVLSIGTPLASCTDIPSQARSSAEEEASGLPVSSDNEQFWTELTGDFKSWAEGVKCRSLLAWPMWKELIQIGR